MPKTTIPGIALNTNTKITSTMWAILEYLLIKVLALNGNASAKSRWAMWNNKKPVKHRIPACKTKPVN